MGWGPHGLISLGALVLLEAAALGYAHTRAEGGIKVTVAATRKQVARLRDFIRCHHAHGRHDKYAQTCLRQLKPGRLSGGHREGEMTMRLLADRPELAATLRKRVCALIAEGR
jgi:hypothetical protein